MQILPVITAITADTWYNRKIGANAMSVRRIVRVGIAVAVDIREVGGIDDVQMLPYKFIYKLFL